MFQKMILSAAMVVSCTGIVRAAGLDDVQAAFQKLADSPNYSWKTTTEAQGGFGGGTTTGKTQKDGLTTLSIVRGDNTTEVVIQGDKAAVKTADGWKSAAEMTAAGGGGGNGGPAQGRFLGMMVRNFKTPVAIAQDTLGKLQNLQQTDGVYSADLSEEAAKAALTFRRPGGANAGGAQAPEVSNAKASVKVWIKDGAVTKVENHVTGTVSFNGNDRDVDRTSTTEFSDVGSTTITVPDEAKAKLTAAPTAPPAGN